MIPMSNTRSTVADPCFRNPILLSEPSVFFGDEDVCMVKILGQNLTVA